MKTISKAALVVTFAVLALSSVALADTPGKHPAYLHALSDLRHARGYLNRLTPSDRVDDAETGAIREINAAIREIKEAAIDDGKNLDDHPSIDTHLDRRGRFRKALELLRKSYHDIDKEEDNEFARGLKRRALDHIAAAQSILENVAR